MKHKNSQLPGKALSGTAVAHTEDRHPSRHVAQHAAPARIVYVLYHARKSGGTFGGGNAACVARQA